jgi:hypothetical protein
MTFEERVQALQPLGFTPRQTRFLVTVALHSGFCLRRQYAAFAQVGYGAMVREFLDALVRRDLARRITYRRHRGFLYHLHARRLYRAIGQEDNRNRRATSPALIARKLMLLDLAISEPEATWYVTEADKVALFTDQLRVPRSVLPQRRYAGTSAEAGETSRYFPHKLPIFVAGDPPTPHSSGSRPPRAIRAASRFCATTAPSWRTCRSGRSSRWRRPRPRTSPGAPRRSGGSSRGAAWRGASRAPTSRGIAARAGRMSSASLRRCRSGTLRGSATCRRAWPVRPSTRCTRAGAPGATTRSPADRGAVGGWIRPPVGLSRGCCPTPIRSSATSRGCADAASRIAPAGRAPRRSMSRGGSVVGWCAGCGREEAGTVRCRPRRHIPADRSMVAPSPAGSSAPERPISPRFRRANREPSGPVGQR